MNKTSTECSGTLSNRDFLAHAFCRCHSEEVPWVTGISGDPNTAEHFAWLGRPALPFPSMIRDSNNNYVVVSTFQQGDDHRYHRRKNCFSGMFVVMIDDIGTKVPFNRLRLKPTCLVETSPGNFQAWYFLREPERDRTRAETLVRGMIASGLTADGTDPGMNGVTRYGRLPIGVNSKAKYVEMLGHPFVQRVAEWSPNNRYSIGEVAAAYGVDLTVGAGRSLTSRHRKLPARGISSGADSFLELLSKADLYIEPIASIDGGHHIICPWVHEHTDEEPTGTVYFEPSDLNDRSGGFKCHHGHCQGRTVKDLGLFLNRLMQLNSRV